MTILIRSAQLFSDYLGKTNPDNSIFDGRRCLVIVEIRGSRFNGRRRWPSMYDVVVKKFKFTISSPGEFLYKFLIKNFSRSARRF